MANETPKKVTFGSCISKEIVDQIRLRERLQVKDPSLNLRPEQIARYEHGNAPWILLASGVDEDKEGGNSRALQNVLTGGTAKYEDGRLTLSESSAAGMSQYSNSYSRGIRPRPGITGLNSKAKDTFGMIMEVEVSLKCWTQEDLENLNTLFFRPGMPALVMWGHTIYADSNGESVEIKNISTSKINGVLEKFFNPGEEDGFETVEDLSIRLRDDNVGALESFLGLVVNFSYSLSKDGGYDCTVKVISKGAILEGLKNGSTEKLPENDEAKSNGEAEKDLFTEITTFLGSKLKSVGRKQYREDKRSAKLWIKDYGKEEIEPGIGIYQYTIKLNNVFKVNPHFHYIYLKDLLVLINHYIISKHNLNDIIPFDESVSEDDDMLYFENEISLNPTVAILPKNPCVKNEDSKLVSHADCWNYCKILGEDGQTDVRIGNIMICTEYICSVFESHIEGGLSEGKVVDILQEILSGVQRALGDINDFDIHETVLTGENDKKVKRFSIVDRNFKPVDRDNPIPPEIVVTGPKTTVTDLSAHSEVNSSIATEMCVAATAEDRQTRMNCSSTILSWNKGLKSRLRRVKSGEDKKEPEPNIIGIGKWFGCEQNDDVRVYEETFTDYVNRLFGYYKHFKEDEVEPYKDEGKKKVVRNEETGEEKEENVKAPGRDFFKRLGYNVSNWWNSGVASVGEASQTMLGYFNKISPYGRGLYKASSADEQSGAMPVKVELTMKGIGGFTVGTIFKISKYVFPENYDNWGYIITGLGHEVSATGWFTKIQTQYYPIRNSKNRKSNVLTVTGTGKSVADNTVEIIPPNASIGASGSQQDNQENTQSTQNPESEPKIRIRVAIPSKEQPVISELVRKDPIFTSDDQKNTLIVQHCQRSGMCARGVMDRLKLFVDESAGVKDIPDTLANLKFKYITAPDADKKSEWKNILVGRNYREVLVAEGLTFEECRNLAQKLGSLNLPVGSVLRYSSEAVYKINFAVTSPTTIGISYNYSNTQRKFRHIQMKMFENSGNAWLSDGFSKAESSFVYHGNYELSTGSERGFKLELYFPPLIFANSGNVSVRSFQIDGMNDFNNVVEAVKAVNPVLDMYNA